MIAKRIARALTKATKLKPQSKKDKKKVLKKEPKTWPGKQAPQFGFHKAGITSKGDSRILIQLKFLLKAIEANDPKEQLLLRVRDLIDLC